MRREEERAIMEGSSDTHNVKKRAGSSLSRPFHYSSCGTSMWIDIIRLARKLWKSMRCPHQHIETNLCVCDHYNPTNVPTRIIQLVIFFTL